MCTSEEGLVQSGPDGPPTLCGTQTTAASAFAGLPKEQNQRKETGRGNCLQGLAAGFCFHLDTIQYASCDVQPGQAGIPMQLSAVGLCSGMRPHSGPENSNAGAITAGDRGRALVCHTSNSVRGPDLGLSQRAPRPLAVQTQGHAKAIARAPPPPDASAGGGTCLPPPASRSASTWPSSRPDRKTHPPPPSRPARTGRGPPPGPNTSVGTRPPCCTTTATPERNRGQGKAAIRPLCTNHAAEGGETYLKSEDWNVIENWRYGQTDSAAIQMEVMHSTAWHKCIFILYAMPG